jgi:hypothetical protein
MNSMYETLSATTDTKSNLRTAPMIEDGFGAEYEG